MTLTSFVRIILLSSALYGCAIPIGTMNPLHIAAERGDIKAVRDWIASGGGLDTRYGDYTIVLGYSEGSQVRNKTALIFAAKNGHLEIVKLLVDAGADLYVIESNDRGGDYGNAFDVALSEGHGEIVRLLWERSDKTRFVRHLNRQLAYACARFCSSRYGVTPDTNLALFIAKVIPNEEMLGTGIGLVPCYSSDESEALARLRFLLAAGVRFPKNTLMCVAASEPEKKKNLAIAELLFEQGADPNIVGSGPFPATPLMLAAARRNLEMVSLLLTRGANPIYQSETGRTALMSAADTCYYGAANASARRQQRMVIQLLLAAGADISARDKYGATAAEQSIACCKQQATDEYQGSICRLLTGQRRPEPESPNPGGQLTPASGRG